jgi:hypothetical protein
VTALAAACFAIGYLLVYAAVASGVDDQGRRVGGWYAPRPWQALFGEPPGNEDSVPPAGSMGPVG